eukprot:1444244-Pyramimonas_sp.AAC.1
MWSPRDFLRLPGQAAHCLAALFTACEKALAFPQQCYPNVFALLPKSVQGERAVSKCSTLYWMYARMRGDHIHEWTGAHADFWDSAARNSSALQAALL